MIWPVWKHCKDISPSSEQTVASVAVENSARVNSAQRLLPPIFLLDSQRLLIHFCWHPVLVVPGVVEE